MAAERAQSGSSVHSWTGERQRNGSPKESDLENHGFFPWHRSGEPTAVT